MIRANNWTRCGPVFNRQPGEAFSFLEFSQYSDFGLGLALISDARALAGGPRAVLPSHYRFALRIPRPNASERDKMRQFANPVDPDKMLKTKDFQAFRKDTNLAC